MRTLDISNNRLHNLPEAIGTFTILKSLNLNNNKLGNTNNNTVAYYHWLSFFFSAILCDGICKLRKLETLLISNNTLSSLPSSFGQLSALKQLNLEGNRIKEFPSSLSGLKNLDAVNLSKNEIKHIPDNVQNIQAVELNLNKNQVNLLLIGDLPNYYDYFQNLF